MNKFPPFLKALPAHADPTIPPKKQGKPGGSPNPEHWEHPMDRD